MIEFHCYKAGPKHWTQLVTEVHLHCKKNKNIYTACSAFVAVVVETDIILSPLFLRIIRSITGRAMCERPVTVALSKIVTVVSRNFNTCNAGSTKIDLGSLSAERVAKISVGNVICSWQRWSFALNCVECKSSLPLRSFLVAN